MVRNRSNKKITATPASMEPPKSIRYEFFKHEMFPPLEFAYAAALQIKYRMSHFFCFRGTPTKSGRTPVKSRRIVDLELSSSSSDISPPFAVIHSPPVSRRFPDDEDEADEHESPGKDGDEDENDEEPEPEGEDVGYDGEDEEICDEGAQFKTPRRSAKRPARFCMRFPPEHMYRVKVVKIVVPAVNRQTGPKSPVNGSSGGSNTYAQAVSGRRPPLVTVGSCTISDMLAPDFVLSEKQTLRFKILETGPVFGDTKVSPFANI